MSWGYTGDPSDSAKDKTRFLIGDTDTSDQQLSDEEILAILADNSNDPYVTAAALARFLAAKYARLVDKTVGDLSISYSQRAKQYLDLAGQLESQAATASAVAKPYAGGISVSDKALNEADTDVVQPRFKRGMHDFREPSSDN